MEPPGRAREKNPIIFGIADTWLSKRDHILQGVANQYDVYRQDMGSGMLGGGAALLIKGGLVHGKSGHHKYADVFNLR